MDFSDLVRQKKAEAGALALVEGKLVDARQMLQSVLDGLERLVRMSGGRFMHCPVCNAAAVVPGPPVHHDGECVVGALVPAIRKWLEET